MQPVSLEVFCESLVRGLLQWLSYACAAGLVGRKSCEGFVIVALAPVSVAVFCGSLVRGLFFRLSIYVDFYRHWVERRPPSSTSLNVFFQTHFIVQLVSRGEELRGFRGRYLLIR